VQKLKYLYPFDFAYIYVGRPARVYAFTRIHKYVPILQHGKGTHMRVYTDSHVVQVNEYLDQMSIYRERREARLGERKRLVHKLQLKEEAMRRLVAEEEEANRYASVLVYMYVYAHNEEPMRRLF
jgi:hypothetical protein